MYGHRTSTTDDDDDDELYLIFNETQMGMASNKYSPHRNGWFQILWIWMSISWAMSTSFGSFTNEMGIYLPMKHEAWGFH